MKKVATNGPMKALMMSLSNFFNVLVILNHENIATKIFCKHFAKISLSPLQIKIVLFIESDFNKEKYAD